MEFVAQIIVHLTRCPSRTPSPHCCS